MARNGISGARARLTIDGTADFGWATNVSMTENTSLQRVDVLGNIDSQEIVPTGRTVTVQCGTVRIIEESLADLGVAPRGGTVEVVSSNAFSIDIYDPITDAFLARVSGCRLENQTLRLDRGGIMMQDASFQGIRLFDQTGI